MQAVSSRQYPPNESVERTVDSAYEGNVAVENATVAEGSVSCTPEREATPSHNHDLAASLHSNVSTANPKFCSTYQ